LNILFVLYYDFSTSSAIHVHNFANALQEQGNDCVVTVPLNKEEAGAWIGKDIRYRSEDYKDVIDPSFSFSNGRGPDIIHAWTPREIVRKQCVRLKSKYPDCGVVVHLEDNEDVILAKNLGLPTEFLELIPDELLNEITPEALSHYRHYKKFLEAADGVTIIIDKLLDFVPEDKPHFLLWPIVDMEKFHGHGNNHRIDRTTREDLGVKSDDFVICYTGSVHSVNYREVRSLYLAVALANREGLSVRLIRTGRNEYDFLSDNDKWVRKYCIELGSVERDMIPTYLSAADLLIQPGRNDQFNAFRLPSKIPEFLSMQRAVAIPNTNIGRYLKDKKEVVLLKRGDSLDILAAIKLLKENESLRKRIAFGARCFAIDNFDKKKIINNLLRFYQKVIHQ